MYAVCTLETLCFSSHLSPSSSWDKLVQSQQDTPCHPVSQLDDLKTAESVQLTLYNLDKINSFFSFFEDVIGMRQNKQTCVCLGRSHYDCDSLACHIYKLEEEIWRQSERFVCLVSYWFQNAGICITTLCHNRSDLQTFLNQKCCCEWIMVNHGTKRLQLCAQTPNGKPDE